MRLAGLSGRSVMLLRVEIRELRSFVLLAELGSILKVASRLGFSPGAIHKHLKTIEAAVGAPVYEKAAGALRLTPAGQLVLPFFRDSILHLEAGLAAVQDFRESRRGLIRVGAGHSFSTYLLPPLVKRFRNMHPHVEVFVETADSARLLERLRGGALDLIFDVAHSSLEVSDLEQAVAWRCQAAILSGSKSVPAYSPLRDLAKTPFILFEKGTRMEEIVRNYLHGLNFRPNVVMRSDNAEAIKAMVRAGAGVAILLAWTVNADLQRRALHIVKTDAPPLEICMALIKRKSAYTSPPARAFIDLVRQMKWKNMASLPQAGLPVANPRSRKKA